MIQRDTCYFCTSTFQLLPIMTLAFYRDEEADLYIDPQFQNAKIIAERINKTQLFRNVVVLNTKEIHKKYLPAKNELLKHFQMAYSYLKVDEFANDVLLRETIYKYMFISSSAYIPRLIYFHFLKNHMNTELLYFEDGIGSYLGNAVSPSRSFDKWIRRFLFGKEALNFNHEKYLFSPDFFSVMNSKHAVLIKEIPSIMKNERLVHIFNEVFLFKKEYLIKERVVLLDILKSVVFTENNIQQLLLIYNLIFEKLGYDNLVVKNHPRDRDVRIDKAIYYSHTEVPFESICMNTNMNQKVLISYGTTAIGTPKIMFDQEPIIILLYRLVKSKQLKGKSYDISMNRFVMKIKQLYTNKTKVMVPNNLNELISALDFVQGKQSL